MRTHSQLHFRSWALAALAAVFIAGQLIGHAHRVAHSEYGVQPAEELWLAVANGSEVSEAEWRARVSAENRAALADPWHHHDNESDCTQFDALCLGDLSVAPVPAFAAEHAPPIRLTRRYVAYIVASVTHTQARAPPVA